MGYLTIFCSFAILLLLKSESFSANFNHEQIQALAVLFFDLRGVTYKLLMIFISIGSIISCYLFFKSRYIPRFISGWGMLGFLLMLLGGFLGVVATGPGQVIETIAAVVVILFEFAIGLWLMIKGIDLKGDK
jgi:hypothetical protein